MTRQATGIAAATALTLGITLAVGVEVPPSMASAASQGQPHARIQPPVATGRLRIAGHPRDGGTVAARGLRWRPGALPAGDRLLSFEVGYSWQACAAGTCAAGADATATPFAARLYVVGHADTGRRLRLTETATEVVRTTARNFKFKVLRVSRAVTAARAGTRHT